MKTVLLFLLLTLGTLTFAQESDIQDIRYEKYSLIYCQDPDDPYNSDGIYVLNDSCKVNGSLEAYPDSLVGGGKALYAYWNAKKKWMIDCVVRKVIPEEIIEILRHNLEEDKIYCGFIINFLYDSSGKIHSLEFLISGIFFEQLTVAQIRQLYWNLRQEKLPFVELFVWSEDVYCQGGVDIYRLIRDGKIPNLKEEEK